MNVIVLTIVMAVSVEAVVEYGKSIAAAASHGSVKTAITQVLAVLLSCLLCAAVGADIYAALGVHFSVPWLGITLTGVFASRGSNYISDFVKKLQNIAQ